MLRHAPKFETRLADSEADRRAALALRYRVFVDEMGADGALVDHREGLEQDHFDAHAQLLLLIDHTRPEPDQVVGVYRLLDSAGARAAGRFYTEAEYDLSPLKETGRSLLELGRSCLHPEYRGGAGMYHLWQGLAAYVEAHGIDLLFGVASFPGTDPRALAPALSLLHHRHLAPPALRVRSLSCQPMDLLDISAIDRLQAMRMTPALIKAYLRLGGVVGEGAYVDHDFNTVDVCMILDTAAMNARQKAIYAGGQG